MNLLEGGNVFKDADGRSLTQRINQTDVDPTVTWLEQLTGLDLHGELDPDTADASHPQGYPEKWLGSTGKKESSGDLDLDASDTTKEALVARLTQWCISHGFKPEEYISPKAIVHFKTPIDGRPDRGYVQTDFTFLPDPPWGRFVLGGSSDQYKGRERNVLMNSIAKSMGYKLNQNAGIADRKNNTLISNDPDRVAKLLLNPRATRADLRSVENILKALERDPKRDAKLADFRQHMEREGLPFLEDTMESTNIAPVTGYTEVNFLAKLRDRIVNQGMKPLIETALMEAEARIPHIEDLVFDRGTRGVEEAMSIMNHAAEDTRRHTTVKWDGKPAIIWGRDENSNFVLTDKSGFGAKGYAGRATSMQQLAGIMQQRGGERGELINIYAKLWPLLEAATPKNFKGYVQGDLLYTETPPEVSGNYEFKPNFVEYRIPANSRLGEAIGKSEVGIAAHTRYKTADSAPEALQHTGLQSVPGLLIVEPTVKDIKNVTPDTKLVKQLRQVVAKHGSDINGLFNPVELRSAQLSDLPTLCKRYVNSRITSDYENLLSDFGTWLQQNVTPRKYNNIVEYLQSPRSNMNGMSAAFTAFLLLHEIKMDMLQQLDRQEPGHEGWVLATPAGRAKLVNRFGFSAGNRILNNPELVS
jgi:Family of unknown function (DUF6267)